MVAFLSDSFKFLEEKSANLNQHQSLKEALQSMGGDPPSSIPFIVWLLENPASPLSLPGKIDLYGHDCLHLLLNKGFSLDDEAFVLGFTMGNDVKANWFHFIIFKLFSCLLYPTTYRFNQAHLEMFDLGVLYGRTVKARNLNKIDFVSCQHQSIKALRELLDLQFK